MVYDFMMPIMRCCRTRLLSLVIVLTLVKCTVRVLWWTPSSFVAVALCHFVTMIFVSPHPHMLICPFTLHKVLSPTFTSDNVLTRWPFRRRYTHIVLWMAIVFMFRMSIRNSNDVVVLMILVVAMNLRWRSLRMMHRRRGQRH